MVKWKHRDIAYWGVWGVGIVLYFLLGRVIPMEARHPIWCKWDDFVPFVPIFVIPYVLWYGLLVFTSVYCFVKEREVFRRFIGYVFVSYAAASAVFVLYPSCVSFRPELTGQDIFSRMVQLIYTLDTPTNVLPSLHVLLALGIAFALCRTKVFSKPLWKVVSGTALGGAVLGESVALGSGSRCPCIHVTLCEGLVSSSPQTTI